MIYAADFETTTNPDDCRVWAFGLSPVSNPDDFTYGNSIDKFIEWCRKGKENHTLYFHNLKFDCQFIISWLLQNGFEWRNKKELESNTFSTLISDTGQFYSMEIIFRKQGHKVKKVTIKDSLKIVKGTIDKLAKDFKLGINKLKLDYDTERKPGHILTNEEIQYLKHDVVILAKILKLIFEQGINKLTIGACAINDYKVHISEKSFKALFPVLPETVDKDIRYSYKGGYCYLNPKYKNKDVYGGIVLDVNSMYPGVMSQEKLPYGTPVFFDGKYIYDKHMPLYVQTIICNFEIKPNKLPTIQLRKNNSPIVTVPEYVTSSKGEDVCLCLTNVDLKLFLEHYNVYNLEYLNGWKFRASKDLFADWVEKWYTLKNKSKRDDNASMYIIAKLMLNNLYGKFATNPHIVSKYPEITDGVVHYKRLPEEIRDSVYVPVASFITAYARFKCITMAQEQYNRFIYADTDSAHLEGFNTNGINNIDDYELGKWKIESKFTRGRFIHAKCYMEEIDNHYKVTCAGLPKLDDEKDKPFYSKDGKILYHTQVNFDNFYPGSTFYGKLQPKNVRGGCVLLPVDFTIKE